jgi:cytochrome c
MASNSLRAAAALVAASLFLMGAIVPGALAEDLDGEALYQGKTCIACHGPDAASPILPDYPKLAGQNEAYLLAQMKAIKSLQRTGGNTPAMAGVMHLVNDEEMAALAKYISGLPTCP